MNDGRHRKLDRIMKDRAIVTTSTHGSVNRMVVFQSIRVEKHKNQSLKQFASFIARWTNQIAIREMRITVINGLDSGH